MVGGRRAWAPGGDSDIVESVSRDVDRRLEENNPLWKRIWYNKNRKSLAIGGGVLVIVIISFSVLSSMPITSSSSLDETTQGPMYSAQVSNRPDNQKIGEEGNISEAMNVVMEKIPRRTYRQRSRSSTEDPVVLLLTDSRESIGGEFNDMYNHSNEFHENTSEEMKDSSQSFNDISIERVNELVSKEENEITIISIQNDTYESSNDGAFGTVMVSSSYEKLSNPTSPGSTTLSESPNGLVTEFRTEKRTKILMDKMQANTELSSDGIPFGMRTRTKMPLKLSSQGIKNPLPTVKIRQFSRLREPVEEQGTVTQKMPVKVLVSRNKIETDAAFTTIIGDTETSTELSKLVDENQMNDIEPVIKMIVETIMKMPKMRELLKPSNVESMKMLCKVMIDTMLEKSVLSSSTIAEMMENENDLEALSELIMESFMNSLHVSGRLESIDQNDFANVVNGMTEILAVLPEMLATMKAIMDNDTQTLSQVMMGNLLKNGEISAIFKSLENGNIGSLVDMMSKTFMNTPGPFVMITVMEPKAMEELARTMAETLVKASGITQTAIESKHEMELVSGMVLESFMRVIEEMESNHNIFDLEKMLHTTSSRTRKPNIREVMANLAPTLASVIAPDILPVTLQTDQVIEYSPIGQPHTRQPTLSSLLTDRDIVELAQIFVADDPFGELFQQQNDAIRLSEIDQPADEELEELNRKEENGSNAFGIRMPNTSNVPIKIFRPSKSTRQPQVVTLKMITSRPPAAEDKPMKVPTVQAMNNVTVVGPMATGYVNIYSPNGSPSSDFFNRLVEGEDGKKVILKEMDPIKRGKEPQIPTSQVTINIFGSSGNSKKLSENLSTPSTGESKFNFPERHTNFNLGEDKITTNVKITEPTNFGPETLNKLGRPEGEFLLRKSTSYSQQKIGDFKNTVFESQFEDRDRTFKNSGRYHQTNKPGTLSPVLSSFRPLTSFKHSGERNRKFPITDDNQGDGVSFGGHSKLDAPSSESFARFRSSPFRSLYSFEPLGSFQQFDEVFVSPPDDFKSTTAMLQPTYRDEDFRTEDPSFDSFGEPPVEAQGRELPTSHFGEFHEDSPLPVPSSFANFLMSSEPSWIRTMGPSS